MYGPYTFLLGEDFSDGGAATVASHGDVKFALTLQIRKLNVRQVFKK